MAAPAVVKLNFVMIEINGYFACFRDGHVIENLGRSYLAIADVRNYQIKNACCLAFRLNRVGIAVISGDKYKLYTIDNFIINNVEIIFKPAFRCWASVIVILIVDMDFYRAFPGQRFSFVVANVGAIASANFIQSGLVVL